MHTLKEEYKDNRGAHFTENCSDNAQQRTDSQNDKSQFPAFDEANDERYDECCVGLEHH